MPHPANRLNTIRLIRGQTKSFLITVKDQDGRPAKLNLATDIRMTVRAAEGDDATALIVKTLGDGIEIVDAAKGKAKVTLSSTDTDIAAATYEYDIWVSYPGTPEVRDPVVKPAQLIVSDSVTTFS